MNSGTDTREQEVQDVKPRIQCLGKTWFATQEALTEARKLETDLEFA